MPRWSGSSVAVAASVALGVGSLAGATWFESSVGSAALQAQLAATCATDVGVTVYVTDDAAAQELLDAVAVIDHTRAPIEMTEPPHVSLSVIGDDTGSSTSMWVLWRAGQFDELGIEPSADDEVLLPDWYVDGGAVEVGDVVEFDLGDRIRVLDDDGQLAWLDLAGVPPIALTVAGTYPGIPTRPEPSFWCGLRDRLRPDAQGDLPPPIGLVTADAFEAFPEGTTFTGFEVRPDPASLTIERADTLRTELGALVAGAVADRSTPEQAQALAADAVRPLGTLVARATSSEAYVHHTVLPVQLAGMLAAIGLMVAAATLVVRERRGELRLQAIRGCSRWTMAGSVAPGLFAASLAGAVVGTAGSWLLVTRLGPSPLIDRSAIVAGLAAGTAGLVALTGVSVVVVMRRSARLVDAPPVRHRRIYGPEVLVVVLAALSYVRLDDVGGARRVGQDVVGGDLLAQAFPLLAALAAVAIALRPASWALRRLRGRSGRLPTPLHLGWSRFTAEPALSVLLIASTSLAVAFAVQATSLATTFERSLDDKARLFIGADLVIDVVDEPGPTEGLGAAATVVSRASIPGIDVLGVDPATFADTAFWRDDASSSSLAELMDELRTDSDATTGSETVPAIVVGGELEDAAIALRGGDLMIEPAARADFFPSYSTGKTLVVVDRAALQALGRSTTQVWIDEPVTDAVDRLVADGTRVRFVDEPAEVFGVTDFLLTRWGYWPYVALGAVMAAATVVAQVLTFTARRRARQQAYVLSRPMGVSLGSHSLAAGIETALPLVTGIIYGVMVGVVATHLAASRLDSLRRTQPPVAVHVDVATIVVATGASILLVALFATVGAITLRRTDPMSTMRAMTE